MSRYEKVRLSRRDMLKLSAGGAGLFALTASGLAVPKAAQGAGGGVYIEAFPTSPLILNPFNDQLRSPSRWRRSSQRPGTPGRSCPGPEQAGLLGYDDQDGLLQEVRADARVPTRSGRSIASRSSTRSSSQVAGHKFTSSQVQPINSSGKNVIPPGSKDAGRAGCCPTSTIYGFNGTFPGPMINAEYGQAVAACASRTISTRTTARPPGLRSAQLLVPDPPPQRPHGAGVRRPAALRHHRFNPLGGAITHEAAFEPGEWVDQMYLGYPAGGDDREKQSFFWFHDHVHGHTGANVYKGMVGLMPIYDPARPRRRDRPERAARCPAAARTTRTAPSRSSTTSRWRFYDCRLDDGVTPHKDSHNGSGRDPPGVVGQDVLPPLPQPRLRGRHLHRQRHGLPGDARSSAASTACASWTPRSPASTTSS